MTRTRRPPLSNLLYVELRKAITVGSLVPGQRLLELQLAEQFGTSQGPVREALSRLTQEGLVVSVPRQGTYVAQPSIAEIGEVCSLRAELESWAVRNFVSRATDIDLSELGDLLASMVDAASRGDDSAFVETDVEFHSRICVGSGSELLLPIWSALDGSIRGTMAVSNMIVGQSLKEAAAMHPPILAALRQRDAPAAERLVREHMQLTLDVIQANVPDQGVSPGVATPSHRLSEGPIAKEAVVRLAGDKEARHRLVET